MRFTAAVATSFVTTLIASAPLYQYPLHTPKFFIISMYEREEMVWHDIPEFNVFAVNITVPGLSPVYPDAHCSADFSICQVTIGEAEINAAASISALVYSRAFDLSKTYFMIAGIAGINPEVGTLGSVTFARYSVQTGLMYEFDAREIPSDWATGYVSFGTEQPYQYPTNIYGTEVFELSVDLQEEAIKFATAAELNDSPKAQAYRAHYSTNTSWAAASQGPSVIAADVLTSDVWLTGNLLTNTLGMYGKIITNGSFHYGTTAQEDNATLEALLRAAVAGLVDFSRIIVMRTGSDMDRPYPGQSPQDNLFDDGDKGPSLKNIYLAGVKVVDGILNNWDSKFAAGVKHRNYIGDIFGTLGGIPDFGPYGPGNSPLKKRRFQDKRTVLGENDNLVVDPEQEKMIVIR